MEGSGYEAVVARIGELKQGRGTRIVGIDGYGGAGKSSLAKRLAEALDAEVVSVDNFWRPKATRPERATVVADPGSDYEWERLRDRVIEPLSRDRPARYRRYDWQSDEMAEWRDVPAGGIVIVEGVFSTRPELAPLYDLRIWVDTPRDICLKRGIERDGEAHRDLWENEWMQAYDRYAAGGATGRCDLVVNG